MKALSNNIVDVVIAAAGQSRRMGDFLVNKPFLLLNGQPLLARCLTFFESIAAVGKIAVVTAEADISAAQSLVRECGCAKVAGVIAGGQERQASVFKGLQFLAAGQRAPAPLVAVHDAARPFLSAALFQELLDTAQEHSAAIPALPVKDTIKLLGTANTVQETLPRARLVAVQTPQVFAFSLLLRAHQQAEAHGYQGTDDAALFELWGAPVTVVKTDYDNLKITTPHDLLVAQALEQQKNA